jgi:hypothetical protein
MGNATLWSKRRRELCSSIAMRLLVHPRIRRVLFVLTVLMLTSPAIHALVIGPGGSGNNPISAFGEPNTATYGQTVTVVAGNTYLNSFSFLLNDLLDPDNVDFAGYVMAWDGVKATGPVLYSSGIRSTTNNGGLGGNETFTFSTGSLSLTAGSQYVLFVSASGFFDGANGTASMAAYSTNPYSGGQFVFDNNGNSFADLSTQAWDNFFGPSFDTAFTATFSEAPLSVPDGGSTLALLGLALIGVVGLRRKFVR